MHAYLITDPAYYGSTPETLCSHLAAVLERHRPDLLCLRDKQSPDYRALAVAFLACCKTHGVSKALLHGDWKLAAELGAFGVHLTSAQSDDVAAAKAAGLFVIVSTHTEEEMESARRNGADALTYSPIYASPGKGIPKGLEDLKERVDKIGINIYALGGIVTPAQIKAVETTGCYGFASIRYFVDN